MMMEKMTPIAWVVLICTALQWLVWEKLLRPRRRYPPGPTPLPIIGNLHHLTTKPHRALAELANIHGPLMLLRFGFRNTVVVSSPEVAREVLQKKDVHFCNRTVPACFSPHLADYNIGLMPANHRWRTLRKIANNLLFSGKILDANQDMRRKKIEDLVSYVRGQEGVAVKVGQVVFEANLNILSNAFFSMDLADRSSELSQQFKQLSWDVVRDSGKPNLVDFFPLLKRADPQGLRAQMTAHYDKVFRLFGIIIDKRIASMKDGAADQGVDVLDALLKICRENTEDFELAQIRQLFMDLFIAGLETSSSTIEWAMAELLRGPTKLKAAQEELHRVVGRGNFVKEADFSRLPYLQGIVKETLRLHPAAPLLLPRKANSDIEVHGFVVPKDSQLLVNVWAIGRDPSLWKNPNDFEPERFLNSEIDFKGNHFELIPFGSGRRICIGLTLATRTLSLFLGNLINFFDWKLEDGADPEDMDDKFGIVMQKATPLRAIPTML